ncbi:MAG: transcriptional repressor LexA [Clostridia bacterium]|nr:transcriptional repressor LexA [Clostridia bacterium]
MNTLTDREEQILEYMRAEIKKKGYPPTVREVCSSLKIKSTSTVHKALGALEEQGYIRKDPAKRRAVEVLGGEKESNPTRKIFEEEQAEHSQNLRSDVIDIPVVGRIAAGTPILAEENIEDSFPVPARFVGKGTSFMLSVQGESMIEAGILDGDYILVQMQNTANNGDIVVAMIDGFESEATVKTFYKEADHIRLQPENKDMNPILVRDVKILGLVKGVFRYLA